MEVILKQDVNRLGKAGSIINVKDGFARNFLIPNGLAVPKSKSNLQKFEQEKQRKSLESERAKKEAEEIKNKLSALSITIPVLTQEEDKIFGSISAVDVERCLKEEGLDIDKNLIIMDEPIKSLGIYEIPIKLHPEIEAKVKVWIVKK